MRDNAVKGGAPRAINTAAEMLGISRPTLMTMIGSDEIASFKVGSRHWLKTEDVLDFERARQRPAFDALRELDDSDALWRWPAVSGQSAR